MNSGRSSFQEVLLVVVVRFVAQGVHEQAETALVMAENTRWFFPSLRRAKFLTSRWKSWRLVCATIGM